MAYFGGYLDRLPSNCYKHHLSEVRTRNVIKACLCIHTDLNEQGVGRWVCLREASVTIGHTEQAKTHLDQPPKAPAQHIIQIGCLVRKIVSCEKGSLFLCWRRIVTGITLAKIDCSPTDLHDRETLAEL